MKKGLSKKLLISLIIVLILSLYFIYFHKSSSHYPITLLPYPPNKTWALSIIDDPDGAKLKHIKPVYELLKARNIRINKAVWVIEGKSKYTTSEYTMADPYYRAYMQDLKKAGFEISLHGASGDSDLREVTLLGYEKFKEWLGEYPKVNGHHSTNKENIYFGKNRFSSSLMRFFYSLYDSTDYSGENPKSPYFWGDIAYKKTLYHRDWYFSDINTLKINPSIPYYNPSRPYVRYWYSVSDGGNIKLFLKLLSKKNISKLRKENGTCILSTHFKFGFYDLSTKKLNQVFKDRMLYLSKQKDLWFVPLSTLLDRLRFMKKVKIEINNNEIHIINYNVNTIEGITLKTNKIKRLVSSDGKSYKSENGYIFIPEILSESSIKKYYIERIDDEEKQKSIISVRENIRCFLHWFVRHFLI